MATENALRFTQLDYNSHRDSLLQRIRSKWALSWNDFLANSFGRILVDLVSWSTTTLAYTINRAAAENFIPTMTLRESAVRLAALVSYRVRNPVAATVLCNARLDSPATSDVALARGTSVTVTTNGTTSIFELAQDYVILEGDLEPIEVILTIAPGEAGENTVNSQVSATFGSENVDLIDTTIDLAALVSLGQYVEVIGGDGTAYEIIDVESAPNATQNNRLVVSPAWAGTSGTYSVQITERRVKMVQGQTFVDTATTPSVDAPNHLIKLTRKPVIEGSTIVSVDGTVWPTVNSLTDYTSTDLVVETRLMPDGRMAVQFGNGVYGSLPPLNSTVSISYRVGGGSAGNVSIGAISATVIGQQSSGQQTITVQNSSSAGEGGMDQESLDEIRTAIPAHVKANDRAVTVSDYEILATSFSDPSHGRIKYARASSNGTNSLLEGNVVTVYAWTAGPSGSLVPVSPGLKNALLSYLDSKAVGTDLVVIRDGTQRPVPVSVRVKVFSGFGISAVKESVTSTIVGLVAATKPGGSIPFSDLVSSLNSVTGVDSLTVSTPLSDLVTGSQTEIFTPPDDAYEYPVDLTPVSGNTYQGQLQVYPLSAWSVKFFVDGVPVIVVPDSKTGLARIYGKSTTAGLAGYDTGPISARPSNLTADDEGDFYYATDESKLYVAEASLNSTSNQAINWVEVADGGSYLDLRTGKLIVSFKESMADVTYKLVSVQGYSSDRTVSVHVSYTGNISLLKRREIRSALKAWSQGFNVDSSLFATPIVGSDGYTVLLPDSRSNVKDVVLHVPGVTSVNRVALENPSNSATRLDPSSGELIKIGSIILNGFAD